MELQSIFSYILQIAKRLHVYVVNFVKDKKNRPLVTIIGVGLLLFAIGYAVKNYYLIEVPQKGGSVKEAFVGSPRFINPILAFSQTDKNLSELIYGSLISIGFDNTPSYELAENITRSQDGKEYVVTLRDDIYFHDGEPITTEDVLFTISMIKDPVVGSPERAKWLGIEAQAISETELLFELEDAYPLFVTNNLTIGIMPEHVWNGISVEEFPFSIKNIQPIGSGSYELSTVTRTETERINAVTLTAFRDSIYTPYIDTFVIQFVDSPNEQLDLYEQGSIDSLGGVSPATLDSLNLNNSTVKDYLLPRVFSIFYQQDTTALAQKEVRTAIDMMIDKDAIVTEVFSGYAQAADSPLPLTSSYATPYEYSDFTTATKTQEAITLLEKNSWSLGDDNVWSKQIGDEKVTLAFTLHVPETDDLVITANRIRSSLSEINIPVTVVYQDIDTLTQETVRPREYELLLFGYVTDIPADLYSFWHSSGKIDPGLNISKYGTIEVDKALESIRDGLDSTEDIQKAYTEIQTKLAQDLPATPLFSPKYIHLISDDIAFEQPVSSFAYPEDRFRNIDSWYVRTEWILPFFVR